MQLNLPQRRPLKKIEVGQQRVPIEQIIAVMGESPVARGIDTAAASIGDALSKRAEYRRQGELLARKEQLARDEKDAGNFNPDQTGAIASGDLKLLPGVFPRGVPPQAATLASTIANRGEVRKDADARIQNLEAERRRMDEDREFKRRERRSSERTNIVSKFTADPAVRKHQTALESAGMIAELANSGNPIAAGAIPTYMARASGEVGALSEADKAPFGGSQAILSRLEAAVTQKAAGKLTPDNQAFINQLSGIMAKRAKANMKSLARTRAKQYGKASDFLNEDEIYSTLYTDDDDSGESADQRKARLLQELQGAR